MNKPIPQRSVLLPANWTDAGTTLGVSLFLAISAVLYVLAAREADPALGIFALALLGFLGGILFLISSTATRASSEVIVGSCCILMLAFIAIFSAVIDGPNAFIMMLLCLPVCYAALNGNPLGTSVIFIAAVALWLLLNWSGWWPDLAALARLAITTLPLLFIGTLVQLLSREIVHARSTITSLEDQDSLTGMLNREALMRRLVAEHQKASKLNTHYALLFIDVDGLQAINDEHGREAGDKTLRAIADGLIRSVRHEDHIGRFSGDEFLIIMAYASDKTSNEVSNRVRQNIYNMTLQFDHRAQRVQVSVGIAIYPDSGQTISEMLKYAEQAMKRDRAFREQQKTSADLREQAGLDKKPRQ